MLRSNKGSGEQSIHLLFWYNLLHQECMCYTVKSKGPGLKTEPDKHGHRISVYLEWISSMDTPVAFQDTEEIQMYFKEIVQNGEVDHKVVDL